MTGKRQSDNKVMESLENVTARENANQNAELKHYSDLNNMAIYAAPVIIRRLRNTGPKSYSSNCAVPMNLNTQVVSPLCMCVRRIIATDVFDNSYFN